MSSSVSGGAISTTCAPSSLQAPSLSWSIAQRLRSRILAREWQLGCEIHDAAIAADYGVSRTPVREAMKLLQHEGLLQAMPRKGMRIALPTAAQVEEALLLQQHLRALLITHSLPADSLTMQMLDMVQHRLQLAGMVEKTAQAD